MRPVELYAEGVASDEPATGGPHMSDSQATGVGMLLVCFLVAIVVALLPTKPD